MAFCWRYRKKKAPLWKIVHSTQGPLGKLHPHPLRICELKPEYAMRGELSAKADIYSFGVIVLEIISCRTNTDLSLPIEMQYLPEYTWKLYERSRLNEIVDPKLLEGAVEKEVLQACQIALLCLQPHPDLRPPMSEIVAMLTCRAEISSTPVKPTFLERRARFSIRSPSP